MGTPHSPLQLCLEIPFGLTRVLGTLQSVPTGWPDYVAFKKDSGLLLPVHCDPRYRVALDKGFHGQVQLETPGETDFFTVGLPRAFICACA